MANAPQLVNVTLSNAAAALSGPLHERTGLQRPQIGRNEALRVIV